MPKKCILIYFPSGKLDPQNASAEDISKGRGNLAKSLRLYSKSASSIIRISAVTFLIPILSAASFPTFFWCLN